MQNEDRLFKDQRSLAAIPFAMLCVALAVTYVFSKVEMVNRPPLRSMQDMASTAQQQTQGQPPPSPMEGKPMPEFALATLDGGKLSSSALRGKVLLVNLWATWCAPCRDEMPSMQKLYRELKGPDFEMVGISIDKEGKKSVAPFVAQLGITFPILLDPESKVAEKFKITGVPETFLVGRDGTILHHVVGPAEWDQPVIVSTLKDVIAKTAGATARK